MDDLTQDQRHLIIQSLRGGIHAAVGDKRIRDRQDRHLVNRLINPDVLRQMLKTVRVASHGDDDLPVGLPQNADAVAIEFPVLVNRAHGDINGFLCRLRTRLRDRANRRTDKMIALRKCIGTGLEIL